MNLPDFTPALGLEIEIAQELVSKARSFLPAKRSGDKKVDLGAALAHITIEHVFWILTMFENRGFSSGYALMRPALEAAYRDIWIMTTAATKQIDDAWNGDNVYPPFKRLVEDIEREMADIGWDIVFGKIKPFLNTLNAYTHSGGEQTVRRLREDLRNPGYSVGELLRDVRTLSAIVVLAVTPIATDEQNAEISKLLRERHGWLSNSN